VEGDGVLFETLAGEPIEELGVGIEVGLGGREVVGVDPHAVLAEVGHVDPVVQRVRRQLAEAGQRAQRVVLQPSSDRRRAVDEPVDHPLVFLLESGFDSLDRTFTRVRAVDVCVREVLLDGRQRVRVGRRQEWVPQIVLETGRRLRDGDDDAGIDLVLVADVRRVPGVRVVRRDGCRNRRRRAALRPLGKHERLSGRDDT
jgi:hypothetical protein